MLTSKQRLCHAGGRGRAGRPGRRSRGSHGRGARPRSAPNELSNPARATVRIATFAGGHPRRGAGQAGERPGRPPCPHPATGRGRRGTGSRRIACALPPDLPIMDDCRGPGIGRCGRRSATLVEKFSIEDAKRLYGVDNWGAGYFDFSPQGNLLVLPTRDPARSIDVRRVVDSLVAEGSSLPLLLRFPQILSSQVRLLCEAFAHAINEYDYSGAYRPAYPIKVNQQRSGGRGDPQVRQPLPDGDRGRIEDRAPGRAFLRLPAEAYVCAMASRTRSTSGSRSMAWPRARTSSWWWSAGPSWRRSSPWPASSRSGRRSACA